LRRLAHVVVIQKILPAQQMVEGFCIKIAIVDLTPAHTQSTDLLISGLRVEGSDRRNSGSRQLVVQKMGFATVDR
ncbi:MAG: hypothetical protein WAM72_06290, partial [Xanthobacteraceae bacterium]